MEKQKRTQSWTISDELLEEIKEYIPKKQRDPNKYYQKALGQRRPSLPPNRCWKESFMFCGPGISGKLFRENMGLGLEKYDELEEIG